MSEDDFASVLSQTAGAPSWLDKDLAPKHPNTTPSLKKDEDGQTRYRYETHYRQFVIGEDNSELEAIMNACNAGVEKRLVYEKSTFTKSGDAVILIKYADIIDLTDSMPILGARRQRKALKSKIKPPQPSAEETTPQDLRE